MSNFALPHPEQLVETTSREMAAITLLLIDALNCMTQEQLGHRIWLVESRILCPKDAAREIWPSRSELSETVHAACSALQALSLSLQRAYRILREPVLL